MIDLPADVVDCLVRVELPSGGMGCGVLLAANVVLTCRHILPTRMVVRAAVARPGSSMTRTIRFDPNRFRTDEALDYAMVELADPYVAVGGVADIAGPVLGDDLVIVQPRSTRSGGPRLRPTRVSAITGPFVQYPEPTPYGCSGAPVFNRGWQLVAIHQSRSFVRGPDGRTGLTSQALRVDEVFASEQMRTLSSPRRALPDRARSAIAMSVFPSAYAD